MEILAIFLCVVGDVVGMCGSGERWDVRELRVRKRYLRLDGGYELGAGGGGCGLGCGGRQNSVGKPVFCLLWGLRVLDLGAGVDKIR